MAKKRILGGIRRVFKSRESKVENVEDMFEREVRLSDPILFEPRNMANQQLITDIEEILRSRGIKVSRHHINQAIRRQLRKGQLPSIQGVVKELHKVEGQFIGLQSSIIEQFEDNEDVDVISVNQVIADMDRVSQLEADVLKFIN